MMEMVIEGLAWAGWILGGCALLYLVGCVVAILVWSKRSIPTSAGTPPISVLKPLCGLEPGLYENLRSFCTQDYPEFQVIFGTQSPDDPALAVARGLQTEFPHLDIQIVSGNHIRCINRKIGNLAYMSKFAAFEYLVASDSSTRVGPEYLRHLAAHLAKPDVGVVTCLYRARPDASVWSGLRALYMNEWFVPSILLGWILGLRDFGFGSTLALRREALDAIGGFEALADQLADDYMLAKLLRRRGLKTVLSGYLVETTVHEPAFSSLWQHELRWVRAVCILQPVGHALSFITHALPVTLLAALLAQAQPWAWMMPCGAIFLRSVIHCISAQASGIRCASFIFLLPVREGISFAVWLGSYFGRHVHWRGHTFAMRRDGYMEEIW